MGYGRVEKSSLRLYFDHPHLISDANTGRFILAVGRMISPGGLAAPFYGVLQVESIDERASLDIGIEHLLWDRKVVDELLSVMYMETDNIMIPENRATPPDYQYPHILFGDSYELATGIDPETVPHSSEYPPIEDPRDPHPPLLVELNTLPPPRLRDYIPPNIRRYFPELIYNEIYKKDDKDRCRPGDYNIPIILTYGDEERVFQDRREVQIHVNTWVERHATKLRSTAVGTALIVGFVTIFPFLVDGVNVLSAILATIANELFELITLSVIRIILGLSIFIAMIITILFSED